MNLPKIPKEYLEQIDCLQPDSDLESILEFEPLQRWAAQSEQHRKAIELAVEKSRKWDQQLQQLMPEIVVPNDLQQRLFLATAAPVVAQPVESASNQRNLPRHHRGFIIALYGASLAMMLMIALGLIGLTDILYRKPAITEADIQRSTDAWRKQLHQCVFRAERPADLSLFPRCRDINPKLKWQGFAKVITEFGPALGSYVGLGKTAEGKPRDCFLLTFRNDNDFDLGQINVSMPPTPKVGANGNQLFAAASYDKEFVHVLLFSNRADYAQLVKPNVILTDSSMKTDTYIAYALSKRLNELKRRSQR